jgi:hypothetical protein
MTFPNIFDYLGAIIITWALVKSAIRFIEGICLVALVALGVLVVASFIQELNVVLPFTGAMAIACDYFNSVVNVSDIIKESVVVSVENAPNVAMDVTPSFNEVTSILKDYLCAVASAIRIVDKYSVVFVVFSEDFKSSVSAIVFVLAVYSILIRNRIMSLVLVCALVGCSEGWNVIDVVWNVIDEVRNVNK